MASEVTLRQVEYFVAAVDAGTMSAAAERIGVSASAVSMGISELESATGADLLVRAPRRPLALTAVGHAVLDDAKALLAAADRLRSTIAAAGPEDLGGLVRMGCFEPFSPFWMPDIVRRASELTPPVIVDVDESFVEVQFERIIAGGLDFALVYNDRLPESFAVERIVDHRPYIIVSSEHRLSGLSEIRLADLVVEPMLVIKQRTVSAFEMLMTGLGLTPHIVQTTTNMETLRTMVGRGSGWSILMGRKPHGGHSLEGRALHGAAIAESVPTVPIVATWNADTPLSNRSMRVIDICHDVIGRRPDVSSARRSAPIRR